jgi:malic enzyme
VSRSIAIAVAREALDAGVAGIGPASDAELEALVDDAMWWPAYVPYEPALATERRRVTER